METHKTSLSPILVHSGRNSASPIKILASFVLSEDVMGCYVLIVIGLMIYGRFMPRPHTQVDAISCPNRSVSYKPHLSSDTRTAKSKK